MVLRKANIVLLLLALVCSTAYAAYISAPEGYEVEDVSFPIPFAWSVYGFDYDPQGDFLVFIAQSIYRLSRTGELGSPLYTFANPVYGSFLKVRDGSVYFGESTYGTIWMMGLDGSNPTQIGAIDSHYDLEFNSLGQAFVSANPYWAGQKVLYLSGGGGDAIVTGLTGYSGPLLFDDFDNLIYGTAYAPGGDTLLRFDKEAVAGAVGNGSLTPADAEVLASISAPSDMVIDGEGNIFITSGSGIHFLPAGYSSTTPFANSDCWLTTMRYAGSTGALSVLVNGVSSEGGQLGVISTLVPIPEPGSLGGTIWLVGLAACAIRRRVRAVR